MKGLSLIAVLIGLYLAACRGKGSMPEFSLRLRDSTTILTSDKIPTGQPVMLIYFIPDCDHCQKETEELLENIEQLKDVKLYFITVDAFDRMTVFNKYYHLGNYSNIVVGQDFDFALLQNFDLPTTPCILLYNKHKKLRALLKGYYPVKQIIAEINKL